MLDEQVVHGEVAVGTDGCRWPGGRGRFEPDLTATLDIDPVSEGEKCLFDLVAVCAGVAAAEEGLPAGGGAVLGAGRVQLGEEGGKVDCE
ncbi:hypothetical protein LQ327_00095 [Actinomycetospora endophytica]|uniref:Uncharacterized protein n=1 Tax=Actinomycetospora endophytica TaxID=2291215 RepID=A0ABS8P0L9_9PSEU|nr:hypothetical protein [Actinomycetospora endophytica]MCD2191791.1 hypothetical protein [Actinomycetospora endophytica]